MFVLAILVLHLCDFLIKVRSNELPSSEKSLNYYGSNGYRSFSIDPATFSWPIYGLQGSKHGFFEKFHVPGMQPNHFKGVSVSQRLPRMYAGDTDKRMKLTHQPVDLPKFYPPYWMSQLYSDSSNSASINVAMEKQLPLSLFYAKPYVRRIRERVASQETRSPTVAMSSQMEKKVPFLVEKQVNKFPAHLTAEQFLQLQGEKYRMQNEKTVFEKPVSMPYPVEKRVPYAVEKPVPYPVEKPVPYPVEKLVPYPVPVPVRTPVEIPVPVPMVKFDPIFIPVREPSTESHAALWVRQNFTSTTESKDLNFNNSINLLTTSVQFDEGQIASTESQFEISSMRSHYKQPVNTSPVAVLQNQLMDASKADSQFDASDKSGDTTELTSTPTVSSSPSP